MFFQLAKHSEIMNFYPMNISFSIMKCPQCRYQKPGHSPSKIIFRLHNLADSCSLSLSSFLIASCLVFCRVGLAKGDCPLIPVPGVLLQKVRNVGLNLLRWRREFKLVNAHPK